LGQSIQHKGSAAPSFHYRFTAQSNILIALEAYETYAREVVYEWLGKMASLQGQPVNTSLYSLLIPFENMGRMGFSDNFGSIQKGKEDPMLHYLEVTLGSIGKLGAMYWPIALLNAIGGSSDHVAFQKLACKMVDKREKVCVAGHNGSYAT
jgi:tryprostatin B 6-hydroxylase